MNLHVPGSLAPLAPVAVDPPPAPPTIDDYVPELLSVLACYHIDGWRWLQWTPLAYADHAERVAAGEVAESHPTPLHGHRVLIFPPTAAKLLHDGHAIEAGVDVPMDPRSEETVIPYATRDELAHYLLRSRAALYTEHSNPGGLHVICGRAAIGGTVGQATGPQERYAAVVTLAMLRAWGVDPLAGAHRVVAR